MCWKIILFLMNCLVRSISCSAILEEFCTLVTIRTELDPILFKYFPKEGTSSFPKVEDEKNIFQTYGQMFVKPPEPVPLHDGVSEDPALDGSRVSQDHGSQPASILGSQHSHPPLAYEGEFVQNISEVTTDQEG